ncbi:hypothetical protein C2S51_030440 [Perilla frutescens var. frutescens]|nr:hypothetical protein C2S51_030440 [Perilla frutescens var. frutescens]
MKCNAERHWSWKRESLQHVSCSINLYWKNYSERIIDILQTVSDSDLVEEFRNGPFGQVMKFVGGTSCNTALHSLMAQKISLDGALIHESWFRVGGTNIRFSHIEYALVTGLMFGGSDFDPSAKHHVYRDCFYSCVLKHQSIKLSDLFHRYMNFLLGDDGYDYLKVANVLFLYNMLYGYDQPHVIEDWVWVLVEDTDRWKSFPWGSYSFGLLLNYMRRIPVTESDFATTSSCRTYHFYGSVWALQIWAYEAVPRLGQHCAILVSAAAKPRCLKWKFFDKRIRIGTLFKEESFQCHVFLEVSDSELEMPYFRSTQRENPLGMRFVVKSQERKRARKVGRSRAVSPSRTSTADRAVTLPRDPASGGTCTSPIALRAPKPPTVICVPGANPPDVASGPHGDPTRDRSLASPRPCTPSRAVIVDGINTPPGGPACDKHDDHLTSRTSGDCLPRTVIDTIAVEIVRGATIVGPSRKRVRTATSSSGTSEEHICCHHVDRYREIAIQAAVEGSRATVIRFEHELEIRTRLFEDLMTKMVEKVDIRLTDRQIRMRHSDNQSCSDKSIEDPNVEGEKEPTGSPRPIEEVKLVAEHSGKGASGRGAEDDPQHPVDDAGVASGMGEKELRDDCEVNSSSLYFLDHGSVEGPSSSESAQPGTAVDSECTLERGQFLKAGVDAHNMIILQSNFFYKLGNDWKKCHPDGLDGKKDYYGLSHYTDWVWNQDLMHIVQGKMKFSRLPWWKANRVITCCLVPRHWVTVVIDLKRWIVYVYDSLYHKTNNVLDAETFSQCRNCCRTNYFYPLLNFAFIGNLYRSLNDFVNILHLSPCQKSPAQAVMCFYDNMWTPVVEDRFIAEATEQAHVGVWMKGSEACRNEEFITYVCPRMNDQFNLHLPAGYYADQLNKLFDRCHFFQFVIGHDEVQWDGSTNIVTMTVDAFSFLAMVRLRIRT